MSSLLPRQDIEAPAGGLSGDGRGAPGFMDRLFGTFGRGNARAAGDFGPGAEAPVRRPDTRTFIEKAFPSLFTIKPREVIVFSRQLATLIDAGIQLLAAMEQLQQQAGGSRGFGRVLRAMSEDVATGLSFSMAVNRHPHVFNETYRRTVTVGEQAGKVETVLRQLADFMEKQSMVSKKFAGAMVYPVIVLVVAVLAGIILTTTALPPLVGMFESLGTELPLPTKILIFMSDFINAYFLPLMVLGVVMVAALVWGMSSPRGRRIMDHWRLTAPLIGPPVHLREMARFSRTTAMLLAAGLPLQEIMELMPQTTNNTVVRDGLSIVRDELMLGQGLAAPMARLSIFPPMMLQMVAVGEESNSLDQTLTVVADFYESAAEEKIAAFLSALQPIMTIGISFIGGFIALAIIMPMYSITGSIAPG